jgi:hypothetical protein
MISDSSDKLTVELERILSKALTTLNEIEEIKEEIKTVASWYRQARTHQDQIYSLIVNQCLDRLIEYVGPYLKNYLVDTLKIKCQIGSDGVRFEIIEVDFAVKPYVEYVRKVNRVESDKIRITFSLVLVGKVEGVVFRSNFRSRQIDVHADSLNASLTVSIVGATVSVLYLPTVSASHITLCKNQLFKVENLSLRLSM